VVASLCRFAHSLVDPLYAKLAARKSLLLYRKVSVCVCVCV
jgi:hypothetical protein